MDQIFLSESPSVIVRPMAQRFSTNDYYFPMITHNEKVIARMVLGQWT